MTPVDYSKEMDGYAEMLAEIAVIRKYGMDYQARKGEALQLVNLLHPKSLQLKVSKIISHTPDTKTLRLTPENGYLPPFQAGQYINAFVQTAGIRTSRPYSISSPPNQTGYYDITLKRVENGFVSNYLLDEVAVGDRLETTSPAGSFCYNPLYMSKNLVFLAGGSGITPFMSMIRELTDKNLNRSIHLVYGCRNSRDIIFRDELEAIAAEDKRIKFSPVISDDTSGWDGLTGFITADLIRTLIGAPEDKMFFVCGPEALYRFCLDELHHLGIPKRQIRTEVFGPPHDVTLLPGWPSSVNRQDRFTIAVSGKKSFKAMAGEPLINSLEREGIIVPASCRSGECSLCRTRLLSGTVYQPREVKLRYSDRQFGYIHVCLAYPLEDIEISL